MVAVLFQRNVTKRWFNESFRWRSERRVYREASPNPLLTP